MKTRRPPIAANWLLERLDVPAQVVGDLVEEHGRGRSTVWYWRQTFRAVAAGMVHQIAEHKTLAVQAIFTGLGLSSILNVGFLFTDIENPGQLIWVVLLSQLTLAALSGWLVARFYRPYHLGMVSAYVLAQFFIGLFRMLLQISVGQWPINIRSRDDLLYVVVDTTIQTGLASAAILVGALLVGQKDPNVSSTA